jgi:hypothetical protein
MEGQISGSGLCLSKSGLGEAWDDGIPGREGGGGKKVAMIQVHGFRTSKKCTRCLRLQEHADVSVMQVKSSLAGCDEVIPL